MTQHYLENGRDIESLCETNMSGLRNPAVDTDITATDCDYCLAIFYGLPVGKVADTYKVTAVDEDGYSFSEEFKSSKDQIEFAEECEENGAVLITISVVRMEKTD